jgi:methionine-rich copper-binding protein CopC
MKRSTYGSLAALVLFGFWSAISSAHTKLESSSPADGSQLDRSPAEIELHFRSPASLTSVVVIEAGKSERKLDFAPKGTAAAVFKVASPKLAPGRNEIQWKALSKDGHVASGTVVLTIKSTAH